MSPDGISNLLACEFDKFVITSKDVCIFPHSFSSFGQVTSPIFDVERDTQSKRPLSDFGGAYSNTLDVCAHDDLIDAWDMFEGTFSSITMFSHAGDCIEIYFDTSNDEENIENDVVDSEFSFYIDKSYTDQPDGNFTKFKVPSSRLLDEDRHCDQYILDQHF